MGTGKGPGAARVAFNVIELASVGFRLVQSRCQPAHLRPRARAARTNRPGGLSPSRLCWQIQTPEEPAPFDHGNAASGQRPRRANPGLARPGRGGRLG